LLVAVGAVDWVAVAVSGGGVSYTRVAGIGVLGRKKKRKGYGKDIPGIVAVSVFVGVKSK
jgi:hypothetical protein